MSAYLRGLGLAYRPSANEAPCDECSGAGYFTSDNGPAPRETDCEACGGTGFIEQEEDDMTTEAQAFTAAAAALAAHGQEARELDLDVAIAKRGGDEAARGAAEMAKAEHFKAWYPLYTARRDAAKALCEALGVDAVALSGALS